MDIPDFAALYRAKTDEELTQLAMQQEQLTMQAKNAVESELAVRRINVESPTWGTPIPSIAIRSASQTPGDSPMRTAAFVEEVLRFYHRNYWTFIKLMFPAVAVGTVAVILGQHEGHNILRQHGVEILRHRLELIEIWMANWVSLFVTWMAFCFSFAAICSVTEQLDSGFDASIRDSFSAIQEQLWPLLKLFILLWLIVIVLVILGTISLTLIPWHYFGHTNGWFTYAISLGLYALLALVLARFGLATPAVILDDYTPARALFRSDQLTKGKLLILALLLFKSIVGGYIAGMLPFWLARWIPASVSLPLWFHWALTGVSIACATAVEPVIFIGFALLYLRATAPSDVQRAQIVGAAMQLSS